MYNQTPDKYYYIKQKIKNMYMWLFPPTAIYFILCFMISTIDYQTDVIDWFRPGLILFIYCTTIYIYFNKIWK